MTAASLGSGDRAWASQHREPGQQRSPVLVPFLTYLTLQFYLYYWVWRVSEEVERFDPYARSPHATARWGVPLALGGSLLAAGSVAVFVFADLLVPLDVVLEGRLTTAVAVLGALVAIGGLAYLVGSALLWVSYWRIWRSLQTHERNLGYAEIRPAGMLALWAGGLLAVGVMPWLGWAVQLAAGSYVLYRTQRGLNRVWTGAAGGYRATPPSSPLTPMAPVDPGPDPRPPTPSAGQPPPLRAGETDIQPPSVEPPLHEEAPAFVCSACGNREPLVDGRRGGVRCPRCGDPSLVPEFGT